MIMKQGMQSNEIAIVQHGLNLSTMFTPKLTVDGIFGPRTTERVKQFQGAKNLAPDGIVGLLTLNALFTGVQLTGTIIVQHKAPDVQTSVPWTFNPFITDPRDVQWHVQVQAWRDWAAKPFPKGPAPPLPSTVPPSLSLPPEGLSVPPLPSHRVTIPEQPPGGSASAPVPLPGANFETSISGGFKSGKVKLQEFKFKLDFAKVTGLIDTNLVQHEVEGGNNDKGDLSVEQKITVTPFKLFGTEGHLGAVKVATLLVTSVNSSFEASQFAGVKGIATFRPFGKGFEVAVGGKLGPKVKLSHDEDGNATTSVYPLAGEGTVEFKFNF
jgi:peptidoglycan hydrolase-like protein with peptidoglycan-binding domain